MLPARYAIASVGEISLLELGRRLWLLHAAFAQIPASRYEHGAMVVTQILPILPICLEPTRILSIDVR